MYKPLKNKINNLFVLKAIEMGFFLGMKCGLICLILVFYYHVFVKSLHHLIDQTDFTSAKKENKIAKEHIVKIGNIQRRDVNSNHLTPNNKENPCKFEGSCERNQEPGYIPVCYCDDMCSIYLDCCHDYEKITKKKTNFTVLMDIRKYITCETETLHTIYSSVFGIFTVSECPFLSEHKYRNMSGLCQTEDVFPVTSIDGITFKNMYCASCHNVKNYFMWTFAFYYRGGICTVEEISNLKLAYSEKIKHIRRHCVSWFVPPKSTTFRFCVKSQNIYNYINNPNLCLKFQNPLSIKNSSTAYNGQYYRNIHCIEYQKGDIAVCLVRKHYIETVDEKNYASVVLTGLFKTHPFSTLSEDKCEVDDMKHSLSIECDNCSDRSKNVCVEELLKNYYYNLELDFISSGVTDISTVLRLFTFYFMSLPVQKYDLFLKIISLVHWCSKDLTEPCCAVKGFMSFTINKAMTLKQISSLISDISNMDCTYRENLADKNVTVFKVKNVLVLCPTIKMQKYYQISYLELKNVLNVFQKLKTFKTIYVPVSVNGTILVKGNIYSNFIIENWKAFYTEMSNSSLKNKTNADETPQQKWKPKSILTYLTLGLSCLSLLVTMSVYQYLELFQSNAGKISRHMMFSLLSAQLVFITAVGATFIYKICLAIAVLSHYFWLCSFSWMSVFCVQVLQRMGNMKNNPGSFFHEKRLPYRHLCFGYILPTCFVLPCVLLEILTDIPIDYTGEICFISGYPANLISFTVPVLISILTNVIALITTSVLISRYNHTIKSLNTVAITRSFIPLYFRSCVLCAFPWMFGILAEILNSDILAYVYIILAGSHGTFVCVSFLSTKTVTNKVKEKFRKKSVNSRSTELNQMT